MILNYKLPLKESPRALIAIHYSLGMARKSPIYSCCLKAMMHISDQSCISVSIECS
jgi:hypothetical protein